MASMGTQALCFRMGSDNFRFAWNGGRHACSLPTSFNNEVSLRWNITARASVEKMLSIPQVNHKEQVIDKKQGLQAFFENVSLCNRGKEKKSQFLPFVVEKSIVGYIHPSIVEHLKQFQDVFILASGLDRHNGLSVNGTHINRSVTLHHRLKTADERTEAVGAAIKWLHRAGIINGLRNELYPVSLAFGTEILFSLERAAVPYFGTKAYAIHMNGYCIINGEKMLWIGKRSEKKSTYPGMLDQLVAGGLPTGITCQENLIKECSEEADIPRNLAEMAVPVGVVSYEDVHENRFERDVLFCYDLLLPHGFQPKNIGI